MKMKKILSIMTALALVVSMGACGATGKTTEKTTDKETGSVAGIFPGTQDEDMVTLNITAEPGNINPMRLSDAISQSVLSHCMAGFTRLNENDEPVADLAEKWEINEDGTVYTMHLKQDVKWSNGDTVTAKDFYDAWVMEMTPSIGSEFASYVYNNIKNGEAFYKGEVDEAQLGLKVVDDYTLEITWSHPLTEENALFYLSQIFFLPINKDAYEEIGDEQYAKEADQMVTNGAYTMTEWLHDDHIILEKNSAYYDADNVQIPKVKFVMIGDDKTSLNAFMAGELDLTGLYSEQITQVKEKSEDAIQSYMDGGSWYLNFNLQNEYLSNLNLRKALGYSIDIQSLLDNVINDGSITADGLVPESVAGANGESYAKARGGLFQYDVEGAKTYLEKALEELGISKEDLKLAFWSSDTTYQQNQAAYLQQQWKTNLGLDVEIKSMPSQAYMEGKATGEYTFLVDGWGPTENDAITFLENFQTESPNNRGKYANEQYDKLIRKSMQESDAGKRQELLIQAEKMLIDDMVIAPMYFTCTTYAISEKLEGITRTPFQFISVRDGKLTSDK